MSTTDTVSPTRLTLDCEELLSRCLGRVEIAQRVLRKFHETIQADVDQLANAVSERDFRTAALVAHRIKGAALAIAAQRLCDLAIAMELSALESQPEELELGLEGLKIELTHVTEFSPAAFLTPNRG